MLNIPDARIVVSEKEMRIAIDSELNGPQSLKPEA
jgi:hypothetical protein